MVLPHSYWLARMVRLGLAILIGVAIATLTHTSMAVAAPAIEWLTFHVPPEQHRLFIEQEEAIWTSMLSNYPAFQGKEIWINPEHPDELIIVTHWASLEESHAVPTSVVERATQQFDQAMGATYTPESKEFHIAWRSHS